MQLMQIKFQVIYHPMRLEPLILALEILENP
jgi:hypothetical protein